MQYLTFLGMGDIEKGYSTVSYRFEDDDKRYQSKYIQEPILKRYEKILDEIVVIVTEQSMRINGSGLQEIVNNLNMKHKLRFVIIEQNITFEEIVDKLHDIISDDFMMDVTHSFRDIPMSVLLSLNYLETSKKCKLTHLFYGKGFGSNSEYLIVDFRKNYRFSFLGNELKQFQKTLRIDIDSVTDAFADDKLINNFIESITSFNKMLEYIQFNDCLRVVRAIDSAAKNILVKTSRFKLLIPFVTEIHEMFRPVLEPEDIFERKRRLIELLLKHNLIQIGITFSDQFIREELIHYTVKPYAKAFEESFLKIRDIPKKKQKTYYISQYLMITVYKIRGDKYFEDFHSVIELYGNQIEKNKKNFEETDMTPINDFYDLRNHINHGSGLEMDKCDILKIITKSFDIIAKLKGDKNT